MRKIIVFALMIAVIMMIGCFVLCSCDGETLGSSGKITIYGSVITWDAISNAETYDVYVDGQLYESTDNEYMVLNGLTSDKQIQVFAISDKGKTIKKTKKATIKKNYGFDGNELKTISLSSNNEYIVDETCQYVKISGLATSVGITIKAKRSSDLYIELDNVTMTSGKANNCFRVEGNVVDDTQCSFRVVFIIKGWNSLAGATQNDIPAQPPTNSEQNGTAGYDGRSAIVLPSLVFTGEGSLILKGGDGGDGGKGAATSGWAMKGYGRGGKGGDGGYGLKCSKMVVALGEFSRVSATGGSGGIGGDAGSNGSITTGPWLTPMWKSNRGANGQAGKGMNGELILISGNYN